jgi:hypothetical protein
MWIESRKRLRRTLYNKRDPYGTIYKVAATEATKEYIF